MNRFKRELRKHGVKLECDYQFLPYNGIETVVVDSENATVSTCHVSAGWGRMAVRRDFSFENYRETVRFFSKKQIEEYFAPRLEGMLARECREYLCGWCGDYKAVLHGYGEYSCEELCELLIDPWDPVRCLDYLGF